MRPEYMPNQKLRILNAVAIHQKEETLPTATRLIDSLLMEAQTFNRLAIELVNEGLLKAFACTRGGHWRLLVLNRIKRTIAISSWTASIVFLHNQSQSEGNASLRNKAVGKEQKVKPNETVHRKIPYYRANHNAQTSPQCEVFQV
jgi:hypothetical protein